MLCGVMSMYCFPSLEFAVSICAHRQLPILTGMREQRGTHNHLRRNSPINHIHKHIKLIQTPNRTPNTLPHSQQQTNSRKTLLSSAKRTRIALAAAGASALSSLNVVGLDFEVESVVDVVEDDLSEVAAVGEVVLECDFAAEGDVTTEVEPFLHAGFYGFLEHL